MIVCCVIRLRIRLEWHFAVNATYNFDSSHFCARSHDQMETPHSVGICVQCLVTRSYLEDTTEINIKDKNNSARAATEDFVAVTQPIQNSRSSYTL